MLNHKLSTSLASYLQTHINANVEVVIELNAQESADSAFLSKKDKMDSCRREFSQRMKPIEQLIKTTGGDILQSAWINQTIKAKLPGTFIGDLAALPSVANIDLSRILTKDIK